MSEALKNNNLTAFIDMVEHLKNLSILAFDKKDFEAIERIDTIKSEFRKHIDAYSNKQLEESPLYSIQNINSVYDVNARLKELCEFKFSGIVERICISALRKTILREQVPEAQHSIFYDISRDIELNIKNFNSFLEEKGLPKKEGL